MTPMRVMTKAAKRCGVVYPATETEYSITLEKGVLSIFKDDAGKNPVFCREFEVGETAEYDSYNLSYHGTITAITNKTVSIVKYPGSSLAKVHRLDIHTFCWRNYDFNLAESTKKNHEEMMYL